MKSKYFSAACILLTICFCLQGCGQNVLNATEKTLSSSAFRSASSNTHLSSDCPLEENPAIYIDSQTDDTVIEDRKLGDIVYGDGTIADNGCGVIAVYNIMRSKSEKVSFTSVKDEMIHYGSLHTNGLFGTNPFALIEYLQSQFGEVSVSGANPERWSQKAQAAEALILLYRLPHAFVMHYVGGIRTCAGKFRFYNSLPAPCSKALTLNEFLSYLQTEDCTPLLFIGVSGKKSGW